jgi:hypothetical protein
MKRREVVVDNQVFDLGLKEIEEAVANKTGRLPTMELEVCSTVFQVGYAAEEKAVALNWWGLTNIRNIVWTRFVFLRLRWPFIKKVECFTYAMEGALR